MSLVLVLLAVLLTGLAGVLLLASYLWFRFAPRVHAETLFPDDARGVALLRYGVAAGFATFGGFLFVFVLHLMALSASPGPAGAEGPLVGLPFEEVAVGLFLLSLSTFLVAGSGYAAEALRTRGIR